MKFHRPLSFLSCLAAIVLGSPPLASQAPAQGSVTAGMVVKDTSGGTVGTIESVEGDFVIVKTDKHAVRVPHSSFAPGNGHLVFGLTQAQLNAQVEAAMAKAVEQIVAGATVKGSGGSVVGTVDSVGGDFLVLRLTSGEQVRLPLNAVAPSNDGLALGITGAQLKAAVAAAKQ